MQSNPNADYVDGKAHSLSASAHTKTSAISSEFKNFLADIEQLISEATSMTGDELAQAKTKFNDLTFRHFIYASIVDIAYLPKFLWCSGSRIASHLSGSPSS